MGGVCSGNEGVVQRGEKVKVTDSENGFIEVGAELSGIKVNVGAVEFDVDGFPMKPNLAFFIRGPSLRLAKEANDSRDGYVGMSSPTSHSDYLSTSTTLASAIADVPKRVATLPDNIRPLEKVGSGLEEYISDKYQIQLSELTVTCFVCIHIFDGFQLDGDLWRSWVDQSGYQFEPAPQAWISKFQTEFPGGEHDLWTGVYLNGTVIRILQVCNNMAFDGIVVLKEPVPGYKAGERPATPDGAAV